MSEVMYDVCTQLNFISVTFIDGKKSFFQNYDTLRIDFYPIKHYIKVWCTMHDVFESRTNLTQYKMHTLQVLFLMNFNLVVFFKNELIWLLFSCYIFISVYLYT